MSKPLVSIITASSNSGSYCIQEIYEKYLDQLAVRAVFRSEEKAKKFREKYANLEIVTDVDAGRPESLEKAFKGAQYALIVTPLDHTKGFTDDALLTANMINSAVANGVNYIVLVASFTVNNMERMPLISARFKPSEILLEKLGKEKGIKWTVLRGGCFMENFFSSINSIKKESAIYQPKVFAPMVDTKDIGKSAAACFASSDISQHDQKYYEMNGPEILSGEDIANVFSKVLGRPIEYKLVPKEALRNVMPEAVAQIYEYMVDAGKEAVPFTQDVQILTGQNGTFEQFVRDHLEMFN